MAWCVLHSVLISTPVLRAVDAWPWRIRRFYRLFYNMISVGTFVPTLVFALSLEKEWVWRWEGPWRIAQLLLFAITLILLIGGARHYDFKQFIGLRQFDRRDTGRSLSDTGRLQTQGMLGVTRHPWYAGAIAFLWAFDLSVARLISNIILTAYLIVGTILEERKLVDEFGDEYRLYQKRVPMLLPLGFFRWKHR